MSFTSVGPESAVKLSPPASPQIAWVQVNTSLETRSENSITVVAETHRKSESSSRAASKSSFLQPPEQFQRDARKHSIQSSNSSGSSHMQGVTSSVKSAAVNDLVVLRLKKAKGNARKQLVRLRVTTLSLGFISFVSGLAWSLFTDPASTAFFLGWILVAFSTFCFPISLHPSDERGIVIAALIGILALLFISASLGLDVAGALEMSLLGECAIGGTGVSCWYIEMLGVMDAVELVISLALAAWLALKMMRGADSEDVLEAGWRALGLSHGSGAIVSLVTLVGACGEHLYGYAAGAACYSLAQISVSLLSCTTRFRHKLQRFLKSSDTFAHARNRGHLRLLCLRGPTLICGPVCVLCGIVGSFLADSPLLFGMTQVVSAIGIVLMLMSMLPSDRRCVPIAAVTIGITGWLTQGVSQLLGAVGMMHMINTGSTCESNDHWFYGGSPCWLLTICALCNLFESCCSFSIVARLSLSLWHMHNAAVLLKRLWRAVAFFFVTTGMAAIPSAIALCIVGRYGWGCSYAVCTLTWVVASAMSLRDNVIERIQSWLMSHGEAATAAASIAELIGGQDPEHVLAQSRENFLCVAADKLYFDDMKENTPNAALGALARKARLGHVTAFVSHSWHDDPESKWAALQTWREKYKSSHRKEPTFWIDKYCIDQNNIEDSLACLPVYLAGCSKLLILCGTTYLQRLWCLIEIFVFLEMGGSISNLEVQLLEHAQVDCFDAKEAKCFTEEDTIRLHNVIAASGYTKINALVRNVFANKLA